MSNLLSATRRKKAKLSKKTKKIQFMSRNCNEISVCYAGKDNFMWNKYNVIHEEVA